MASNIKFKRSSVAGKVPTAGQLPVGELAINTADGIVYTQKDDGSIVPIAGAGSSVTNVIYVTKDGNDTNDGLRLGTAKATIKGAVAISTSGDSIQVYPGTYLENNPIVLPPHVSIQGRDLRTTVVAPQNITQDIFQVGNGNHLIDLSFTGAGCSACVAFRPEGVGIITQSPYVRNCTNFIPGSIGMKVDGLLADDDNGVSGSMVVDSYTQYNPGGIGVSISNEAYAQLVSIFTINSDIAISATNGGQGDITNSNSSFGNFGLVASGLGTMAQVGIVTAASGIGSDRVVLADLVSRPYDGQVLYFDTLYYELEKIDVTNGGSGYTSPPTVLVEAPSGPNGATAFAAAEVANGQVTAITVLSNGSQYTQNPTITLSGGGGTGAAVTTGIQPLYYGIESATPVSSGISTVVLKQTLNNSVGVGSTAPLYQQSLLIASSHSFEYVGAGTDKAAARPRRGGVGIQTCEVVTRDGGLIVYTSTDQAGNFAIGPDVNINQATGTITGRAFSQSLLNTVTPLIIALED